MELLLSLSTNQPILIFFLLRLYLRKCFCYVFKPLTLESEQLYHDIEIKVEEFRTASETTTNFTS